MYGGEQSSPLFTLITSTDFHAAIDQAEVFVAAHRAARLRHPEAVAVNAGDLFQGSIEGNESKGRAVIDVFNLASMDLVAMGNHDIDYGPSRHGTVLPQGSEHPRGALNDRVKQSDFYWLAANVTYKKSKTPKTIPFAKSKTGQLTYKNAQGHETLFPPHVKLPLKQNPDPSEAATNNPMAASYLCFIGATTVSTPHITFPAFVDDLEFLSLHDSVAAEARYLKRTGECAAIILVAHAGLACTPPKGLDPNHMAREQCLVDNDNAEMKRLLESLPRGLIDLAVAGHTHIHAMEWINGTAVIESGAMGSALGIVHFYKSENGNQVVLQSIDLKSDLKSQLPEAIAVATADVSKAMAPYRERAKKIKAKPVGQLVSAFKRMRFEENALANAIAASYHFKANQLLKDRRRKVDVAITNAGGVRQDLLGPLVNYGDIYNTIPFDNHLATVKLRGDQLLTLLQIATSGAHGVPGIYGATIHARKFLSNRAAQQRRDLNGDGMYEDWEQSRISEVLIDNKPLDTKAYYNIATIDFLVQGGDHNRFVYGKIDKSDIHIYYDHKARDVFAEFMTLHSPADPSYFYNPPEKEWIKWMPSSENTPKN